MILALVDDLLFTSKIRTAARQLGVELTFARSTELALDQMRKQTPSLVILDLNNRTARPLETVAAMKAEPTLADVPTVGFVSHVDADTIQAARHAGVGEILARSTFVQRLPEFLRATQAG